MRKRLKLSLALLLVLGFILGFFLYRNKFTKNHQVSFQSEVPGLVIEKSDSRFFYQELERLLFWEDNTLHTNAGTSLILADISSFVVVLSPAEQAWGGIYSQERKKRVASFDFAVHEDVGTLVIWIEPSYYENEQSLNALFSKLLYEGIFTVSNWGQNPGYTNELTKYLNEIEEKNREGIQVNPVNIIIQ